VFFFFFIFFSLFNLPNPPSNPFAELPETKSMTPSSLGEPFTYSPLALILDEFETFASIL